MVILRLELIENVFSKIAFIHERRSERKVYIVMDVHTSMPDVKRFVQAVRGVRSAFLTVDNHIVQSTFMKDVDSLLWNLSLIAEALMEKHGAVQQISMSGDRILFFFYHKNMVLGIEGDQTISLPILNVQVRIFFKEMDEPSPKAL